MHAGRSPVLPARHRLAHSLEREPALPVCIGTRHWLPSTEDVLLDDGWRRGGGALALYPGLCITVTVAGLNLLGDGLRDLLDPWRRPGA